MSDGAPIFEVFDFFSYLKLWALRRDAVGKVSGLVLLFGTLSVLLDHWLGMLSSFSFLIIQNCRENNTILHRYLWKSWKSFHFPHSDLSRASNDFIFCAHFNFHGKSSHLACLRQTQRTNHALQTRVGNVSFNFQVLELEILDPHQHQGLTFRRWQKAIKVVFTLGCYTKDPDACDSASAQWNIMRLLLQFKLMPLRLLGKHGSVCPVHWCLWKTKDCLIKIHVLHCCIFWRQSNEDRKDYWKDLRVSMTFSHFLAGLEIIFDTQVLYSWHDGIFQRKQFQIPRWFPHTV